MGAAEPTPEKSVSPSTAATAVAPTRPRSTAMVDMKPLKTRWTTTMTAIVARA